MTLRVEKLLHWVGAAGMGAAFATGGWAMAVTKDITAIDRRVTQIEQPFTDLRLEMAGLRAEVKALTKALEKVAEQ